MTNSLPAEQISKIDIYKGGENNLPTLHRLHGKEWERQKIRQKNLQKYWHLNYFLLTLKGLIWAAFLTKIMIGR